MIGIKDKDGRAVLSLEGDSLRNVDLSHRKLCGAVFRGADLTSAVFSGSDLRGADFTGSVLDGATFKETDLRDVSMVKVKAERADFSDADLCQADMSHSCLRGSDFQFADLRYVTFTSSDLSGVYMYGADMRHAIFRGADLSGAVIRKADLYGALLSKAELSHVSGGPETKFFALQCPEEGPFVAYKKVRDVIVKLLVPEDAERSSATTRKCRCSKAKVLGLYDPQRNPLDRGSVVNRNYTETVYAVGDTVYPDAWDGDRWNECSHGIHFFLTFDEAAAY